MDHLVQDLGSALQETENSSKTFNFVDSNGKWSMRRRTRSAGNLHLYGNNSGDNVRSDDSSSSPSEVRNRNRLPSFHQSDSDEMSLGKAVARALHGKSNSWRMRNSINTFIKGRCRVSHTLESDSVNENSPARPSLRRKRKLKRMSIDEAPPILPSGKRKRSQRLDIVDNGRCFKHIAKIKPLHPSIVGRIDKLCQIQQNGDDPNSMETQSIDDCEFASESSISWSGGEGHDGDDELTDWAPPIDTAAMIDQNPLNDADPREIRAGCRRLGDERPGFSISTGANERVAKFLQDTSKSELRLSGAEHKKLSQLAALYSLDLFLDNPNSLLLRKTSKTPSMQPTQRHHNGFNAAHKRIRTQDRVIK